MATDRLENLPRNMRIQRNILGLCLLVCMLVGGGTARGLLIDTFLQLLVIICSSFVLFSRESWDGVTRAGLVLLVCVLGLFIVQLVPIPVSILELMRPSGLLQMKGSGLPKFSVQSISVGSTRTIEAGLFVLMPILFFTALVSLSKEAVVSVVPFFMIGLWGNLVAAGLQYSFSNNSNLGNFLGYEVMIGMFANRNHFATLIFSSIPLIIYFGFSNSRMFVSVISLLVILLILLAVGSRAGILIGISIVTVSFVSLLWQGRIGKLTSLVLVALIAIAAYGAYTQISVRAMDPTLGRLEFATTTWQAIKQNWILGTGYGTFDLVYPLYESPEMVFPQYVNHAHNDYLEAFLEGGILALVVFLVYVFLLVRKIVAVRAQPLPRLVFLSIVVVLVHSFVDYPLRTMSVLMVFAFLNALLFSYVPKSMTERQPRSVELI